MKTQKDVVVVVKTKSGNPVLMYCGANVPHEKPYLIGTRVIGNFLPAELLGEALRLIKANYQGEFKDHAVEDLYPRVQSLVNKVYKGDVATLTWLGKSQPRLVTENEDLFARAVTEVKKNPKRQFPELCSITGLKKEALRILKGQPK